MIERRLFVPNSTCSESSSTWKSNLRLFCLSRDERWKTVTVKAAPTMSSIFKKESNRHWILFSLHKEIIEHSHSLWFPRKGIPIDDYAKDGGEELFTKMHCVRITNL